MFRDDCDCGKPDCNVVGVNTGSTPDLELVDIEIEVDIGVSAADGVNSGSAAGLEFEALDVGRAVVGAAKGRDPGGVSDIKLDCNVRTAEPVYNSVEIEIVPGSKAVAELAFEELDVETSSDEEVEGESNAAGFPVGALDSEMLDIDAVPCGEAREVDDTGGVPAVRLGSEIGSTGGLDIVVVCAGCNAAE